MKPACPVFFRRMCLSSIAFISRLAPTGVWLRSIKVLFSLFLFFFHHLGCDLNFDGDRHCHQRKEPFFECQLYSLCSNFSEYSSTVEDQPVMHWSLTVTFFSHLLNVTSLKQWTPLTLLRSLSGAQTSAVFCMYGLLLFLPRMSLFIHEDFLFYDETLTFWD